MKRCMRKGCIDLFVVLFLVTWKAVILHGKMKQVALVMLHECVEGALKEEKRSLSEVFYYSEDFHREFVPLVLALIKHVALSIPDCEENVTSKLKDVL